MCVGFLERLYRSLAATRRELSSALVEEELIKACAEAKGKESRLVRHTHIHTHIMYRPTKGIGTARLVLFFVLYTN